MMCESNVIQMYTEKCGRGGVWGDTYNNGCGVTCLKELSEEGQCANEHYYALLFTPHIIHHVMKII